MFANQLTWVFDQFQGEDLVQDMSALADTSGKAESGKYQLLIR